MNQIYRDKRYYEIAKEILRNKEFQRRRTFLHHQDSVYAHSLRVSYVAYRMARFLEKYISISVNDVIIGGLLHDFYLHPWREQKHKTLNIFKMHGFTHAKIACLNSYQVFPQYMNKKVDNIIRRHMFPLNIIPPRYLEGWLVTIADKVVSLEVFRHPLELPRYVGLNPNQIIIYPKRVFIQTKKFISTMY